jgi:hypothetical protein
VLGVHVLGVMEELVGHLHLHMPADAHVRGEDATPDLQAA